jgi:pilus assembly protein CpaE
MDTATPIRATTVAQAAAPLAMIYARDRDSEGIIRQSLSDLGIRDSRFGAGGIAAAIKDLAHQPSPRLLIVDVGGVDDPVEKIHALGEVCEPGTGVIAIGDANDIILFRDLKDAGVFEYFFKPLVSNLVSRACNNILTGNPDQQPSRTGKLVFGLGVRGGVGNTTLLVRLAWHLAQVRLRRVILIDLDLYSGDAALQLDAVPTHALREALEHPERVDELFLDRGVTHVTERLHLLASLEPITTPATWEEDAVLALIGHLLHTYHYVFVDIPPTRAPWLTKTLHLPSVCVLVSDGTLVSARDVARWREHIGPNSPERTTLHILNKSAAAGSLPVEEFERAAGKPPDIVIPYEREIAAASNLGRQGMEKSNALQRGLALMLRHIAGEQIKSERPFFARWFR